MKALLLILILLMNTFAFAKTAEEELRDLHFFYDNKGMILPPSFLPFSLKSGVGKAGLVLIKNKLKYDLGLNINEGKIVGYHEILTEHKNRVGVVGCAICHAGRAAGQNIIGLGNKNIDIYRLALTAKKYINNFEKIDDAKFWHSKARSEERRELGKASAYFIDQISNKTLSAKTQGLIPIALVRSWFYKIHNVPMDTTEPGQVKIPSFWGYGEKRKVGSFSDGFGNGVQPGWAVAVELVAGQTPENVRKYIGKLHKAEDVLADLIPPEYPFQINAVKAQTGKVHFENSCAKCHGTYSRDPQDRPNYIKPEHKPWRVVRTDPTRLEGVTELFRELVKNNPLNDIMNATDLEPGYIAPRLHGIWARFPYLHNGSVPTLYDLLKPENERPKYFSLRDAGELRRFDKVKLGLNKDSNISQQQMNSLLRTQARYIYDTRRHGHGNMGHNFEFYSKLTDKERYEIIEYLKTL